MFCQIVNRFKQRIENKGRESLNARRDSKQFKGSLTETKNLVRMTSLKAQGHSKIQVGQMVRSRGHAALKIKEFLSTFCHG
jgi:hypothetical protein